MTNENIVCIPPDEQGNSRAVERHIRLNAGHYWQYCVNCGMKMEGRKCKLVCPQCGFYHSCSEL